jgi:hypothetical protein
MKPHMIDAGSRSVCSKDSRWLRPFRSLRRRHPERSHFLQAERGISRANADGDRVAHSYAFPPGVLSSHAFRERMRFEEGNRGTVTTPRLAPKIPPPAPCTRTTSKLTRTRNLENCSQGGLTTQKCCSKGKIVDFVKSQPSIRQITFPAKWIEIIDNVLGPR